MRGNWIVAGLLLLLCVCMPTAAMAQDAPKLQLDFEEAGEGGYALEGTKKFYETLSFADRNGQKAAELRGEQFLKLEDGLTDNLTDFTVSAWFSIRENRLWTRVFDLGAGEDASMFFCPKTGTDYKARFQMKKGDRTETLDADVKFLKNTWYHVAVTKQGSLGKLYINGEMVAQNPNMTLSPTEFGHSANSYIGKSQYATDPTFAGAVDSFRLYDRALSENEVCRLLGEVRAQAEMLTDRKPSIVDPDTVILSVQNGTDQTIEGYFKTDVYDDSGARVDGGKVRDITLAPGEKAELSLIRKSHQGYGYYFPNIRYCQYSFLYNGEEKPCGVFYGNPTLYSIRFPNTFPKDTDDTTLWAHDPSIFKSPQNGKYYVYSTGMIDVYESDDLISWTRKVNTQETLPKSVTDETKLYPAVTGYSNIWAPDVHYQGGKYYNYYSYSHFFGKNNSSIGLLSSDRPDGPWRDEGLVLTSTMADGFNAIDANYIKEEGTGKEYLVYGSFWDGIFVRPLDREGKLNPDAVQKKIASSHLGQAIEGAYVIYNPDTKYYYLFASYDILDSTYNVRVGRAKSVTGPYLDADGNDLARPAANYMDLGYKLTNSYQFGKDGTEWVGPGHCSVLNDNGAWYLAHHAREKGVMVPTLHIRNMLWTNDGWPVVSPERYAGETLQNLPRTVIQGDWEFLTLDKRASGTIYSQTITLLDSITGIGQIKSDDPDKNGTWKYEEKDSRLTLSFDDGTTCHLFVLASWDEDHERQGFVLTGMNQEHVQVWGKKAMP